MPISNKFGGLLFDKEKDKIERKKDRRNFLKAQKREREKPSNILYSDNERCRLINDDFRNSKIEEDSIDFIITDPPYPKEFIPLYVELAKKAEFWLKPGGSLLAMAGQSYLPEVVNALSSTNLKYHWTLGYLTPGGQGVQIFPRSVISFWKPILWFVKGTYNGVWIGDTPSSYPNDNDKRYHRWGQSESGFIDLIQRFTKAGDTPDVICDPFMGGGTTAIATLKLNRHFVGIELDGVVFEKAKARIAEVLE